MIKSKLLFSGLVISLAVLNAAPQQTVAVAPEFAWRPAVKSVKIDKRGNVLVELDASTTPFIHDATWKCGTTGVQINRSGYGGYSIQNAQGDGASLFDRVNMNTPQIIGATGNGIVVKGSYNEITRPIIIGVSGTALAIEGSNNSIDNMFIADCKTPLQVTGENNFVSYAIGKPEPILRQLYSGSLQQRNFDRNMPIIHQ